MNVKTSEICTWELKERWYILSYNQPKAWIVNVCQPLYCKLWQGKLINWTGWFNIKIREEWGTLYRDYTVYSTKIMQTREKGTIGTRCGAREESL